MNTSKSPSAESESTLIARPHKWLAYSSRSGLRLIASSDIHIFEFEVWVSTAQRGKPFGTMYLASKTWTAEKIVHFNCDMLVLQNNKQVALLENVMFTRWSQEYTLADVSVIEVDFCATRLVQTKDAATS